MLLTLNVNFEAMEYKITEIIDGLIMHDITKADAVRKLLNLHIVSDSVCSNCDGYGYTTDENGRRKEHCDKC